MATKTSNDKEDSSSQLLLATIKNTNGQINFQGVADEMGIASASAAQKRVKRYLDKITPESIIIGSTLGSGNPVASPKTSRKSLKDDEIVTPQTPTTPKESKEPTTPKTQRTPKLAKNATKRKASAIDANDDTTKDDGFTNKSNGVTSNGVDDESIDPKPDEKADEAAQKTSKPARGRPRKTASPKKSSPKKKEAVHVDDADANADEDAAINVTDAGSPSVKKARLAKIDPNNQKEEADADHPDATDSSEDQVEATDTNTV